MGDGFMASFSSATKALESAIAMQRAFAERNQSAEEQIWVRVGLNAGEPIAEDNDFFGTAVQLAARVCDRAEPGQVLVSNVVRELCAGKKLTFTHNSDATLKGFDEPVALFEVLREPCLCPEWIVLETGTLSFWLARGLGKRGLPVDVIDARPGRTRQMKLQHNKTDAGDALSFWRRSRARAFAAR